MDLGDSRWWDVAFLTFVVTMLLNKQGLLTLLSVCAQLPSEKVQTQFTANSKAPLMVSTNADLITSILGVAQVETSPNRSSIFSSKSNFNWSFPSQVLYFTISSICASIFCQLAGLLTVANGC